MYSNGILRNGFFTRIIRAGGGPSLQRTYRNPQVRSAFERLRVTQLREGSLYANLRTFIPVVVLGVAWFWINHFSRSAEINSLVGRSVTVRHLLLAVSVVILWNLWLSLSLFEHHSIRRDLRDEVVRLFMASVFCGGLPLLVNMASGTFSKGFMLQGLITAGLLSVSFTLLGFFLIAAAFSSKLMRTRVALIVGSGKRATLLRQRLQNHYSPFEIFGCVDDEYHGIDEKKDGFLGSLDRMEELLKNHPIEVVLIGLPIKSKYDEIQRAIQTCELIGVESHYMHDFFDTSKAQVETHSQEPRHFAVLSTVRPDPKQYIKRMIDLVLAAILIALFSPFLIAAALAVRFTSAGPVFFVQQRYGLNRKRFPMFKFRSMVVDAEARQAALEQKNEAQGPVFKLKSDPRVTTVGSFLRKTSIDELPQLFNVLRGEMSLVGPRPLPLRDVSRFEEPWLLRRFSVRPGLTCLWQVTGRSNTSFDFWISQDLAYIDGWSLGLDLKILVMTIPAVLKGSGAV